jgi:hypothetical protein
MHSEDGVFGQRDKGFVVPEAIFPATAKEKQFSNWRGDNAQFGLIWILGPKRMRFQFFQNVVFTHGIRNDVVQTFAIFNKCSFPKRAKLVCEEEEESCDSHKEKETNRRIKTEDAIIETPTICICNGK